MPSAFEALVAGALAPAVSATFGRSFTLQPRAGAADPNAPVGVDASRAAVTFLADLRLPVAKQLIPDAYDPRTNRRPGTEAQHPLLRIQPDQVAPLGLDLRDGDLLVDGETGVAWRVSSHHVTKTGVIEAKVNLVG